MSLTITSIPTIDINQPQLTVQQLLDQVGYEVDQLYVDKFWNNIENDKWIYIGRDMLEWIGYSTERERQSKELYVKLITKHFTVEQDYVHLTATEFKRSYDTRGDVIELPSDFNTHNKAKHLMVSPDCFKESLMLIETNRANEIRKYYIAVEKAFKFYLKYQSKYQELKNEQTALQLEEEKSKNTNLMNTAIDCSLLQKKEYLYIATNTRYASQNNFKIGKTLDLKQRLSAYNTSHNSREPYYYTFVSEPTYHAKTIEYTLKHILSKFKNSETNELYVVNYSFLEKMVKRACQHHDAYINYYNECIQSEMNHLSKTDSIPKDIWNVVKVEEAKEETTYNGQTVAIEYYDNNRDYSFIRFQTKNKNYNFKCNRCDLIFARKDHIQAHFRIKVKCFDTSKQERLNAIKANAHSPTMKYYRDKADYGYTETFSNQLDCIEYNCSRCEYATTNFPSLKKHFDRKKKCYDVVVYSNDKIVVEHLNDNNDFAYYRYYENDILRFHCNHCEYTSGELGNVARHFKRKNKCW